ncbi:hypothetical protein B6N60_00258 [Richelia sinica FACHB-800]|uniref:Uncharacterized protein n=1 Tax=Richelia sinica FACHB-800 TaxID=1357546 RepID=A0A975T545_9NOST|nr:hypothetical protein B6N60_00258 [Richelia sinica FACHB-800]
MRLKKISNQAIATRFTDICFSLCICTIGYKSNSRIELITANAQLVQ